MKDNDDEVFIGQLTLAEMVDTIGNNETFIRTLRESEFESTWLHYFLGPLDPDSKEIPTSAWLSVARSPYLPVDVIDDRGVVQFRVPALWEDRDFNTDHMKKPISVITRVYGEYMRAESASMADGLLNEYVESMMSDNKLTKEQAIESLELWISIFSRYEVSQGAADMYREMILQINGELPPKGPEEVVVDTVGGDLHDEFEF